MHNKKSNREIIHALKKLDSNLNIIQKYQQGRHQSMAATTTLQYPKKMLMRRIGSSIAIQRSNLDSKTDKRQSDSPQ